MANYSGDDRNNTIYGSAVADQIYGGDGDDYLSGGGGNDQLFGGNGDDTLIGGDGNDRYTGGRGNDALIGGAGADTFDYNDQFSGFDTIFRFFRSDGDKIDFRTLDGNRNQAGDQALRFVGEGEFVGRGIGSVKYYPENDDGYTRVYVDADGDGYLDFGISLTNVGRMYSSDFLL